LRIADCGLIVDCGFDWGLHGRFGAAECGNLPAIRKSIRNSIRNPIRNPQSTIRNG
jgi:hypothetical protein